MSLEPAFDAFSEAYDSGRQQVVWTRLIDDLETPVSAYLKIAQTRPYSFLFESVEGGTWRGRYSIVTMNPDLVWRCRGDQAEIAEGDDIAAGRYTLQPGGALDSLRDLVAQARMELPKGLPPMAAGVFGALGYDLVRLVERLPDINEDTLGLPDGIMTRPSIVAVFDAIAQEIILATSVRPGLASAAEAYAAAEARLEAVAADLRRPIAPSTGRGEPEPDRFTTQLSKTRRRGRILIDTLRNRRGATWVAPYSPRAREGIPVSTPVSWAELTPRLTPARFTFETVPVRMRRTDPWAEMGRLSQTLTASMLRKVAPSRM